MNFKQLPDEFYPTPPELAAKMVNCKFLKSEIETILEPSAGKGDLIDFLSNSRQNTPASKRSKSGGWMNANCFLLKLLTIGKIYTIIDT